MPMGRSHPLATFLEHFPRC